MDNDYFRVHRRCKNVLKEFQVPRHAKRKRPSRKFDELRVEDLELFFRAYPCFEYLPKEDLVFRLRKLYGIRNKVAHCLDLTENQFQRLHESHVYILESISSDDLNES